MQKSNDATSSSPHMTVSETGEKESEKIEEGVKIHHVERGLNPKKKTPKKKIKSEIRKADDVKERHMPGHLKSTRGQAFSVSLTSFSSVGQRVLSIVTPKSEMAESASTVEFPRKAFLGEEEEEKIPGTETKKEKEKTHRKTHKSREKEKGGEEAVLGRKGFDSVEQITQIVNDWDRSVKKSQKVPFTKIEAKKLHSHIRNIIKFKSSLNLGEVMRIRLALQHKCQNPNIINFYLAHKKFQKNFIILQNRLFKLQEKKAPEILHKRVFAGLDLEKELLTKEELEEKLEEQKKIIEELSGDSSIETIEEYCRAKRSLLVQNVLSGKRNYSLIVEQIATELNERTLEICQCIDFVNGKFIGSAELAQRRDSISNFVNHIILDIDNIKKRTKMFVFFLDVSEFLVDEMGDYHSSQGIADALFGTLLDRTLCKNVNNDIPLLKDHNVKRKRLNRLIGGSNFGVEEIKEKMEKQKNLPTFVMSFELVSKKMALASEKKVVAALTKEYVEEQRQSVREEQAKEGAEEKHESVPEGYSREDRAHEGEVIMRIPLLIAEHAKSRDLCLPGIYTDFISLESLNVNIVQGRSDQLRKIYLKTYVD